MKEWSVRIYLLDQDSNEHPANCFTKVTYNLHPSFANPNQSTYLPFSLAMSQHPRVLTRLPRSLHRSPLHLQK